MAMVLCSMFADAAAAAAAACFHLEDEGRFALVSAIKDSASAGEFCSIVGPGSSSSSEWQQAGMQGCRGRQATLDHTSKVCCCCCAASSR
jgi:hypothetical protein